MLTVSSCDELGDWSVDGSNGWSSKGLKLADFGRSIDTRLYGPKTCFVGDRCTEAYQCVEMKTGRPWTFQIDTYGVCETVYAMLHGKYLEVVRQQGMVPHMQCRWKPLLPFKRYWQSALWEQLFDELLNVPSCEACPSLSKLRRPFEEYLARHARDVKHKLIQHHNSILANM